MITINFASGNYRLIERLHIGITSVNALLAAAAVAIIFMAVSLRADIRAMDGKEKELQAAEEHMQPLLAERQRVTRNLAAMSGLIESRRFSWTRLLTGIENVFPVGVALDKMQYGPRDHMLILDGAAQSPESLRNLIIGLEQANVFKDPYLKHQSLDKGNISFNVVVSYQGHKTAGLAQGK